MFRFAFGAAVAITGVAPAQAQDAIANFYRGKQISIIVGTTAGGGYDAYARLVARHLGKHIQIGRAHV